GITRRSGKMANQTEAVVMMLRHAGPPQRAAGDQKTIAIESHPMCVSMLMGERFRKLCSGNLLRKMREVIWSHCLLELNSCSHFHDG
ncbi:MAG TPA: hypothetical protein VFM10_12120, partial [Terriglobales bacterium]|nr:hypothetical protein [Terriglobales bacterium]